MTAAANPRSSTILKWITVAVVVMLLAGVAAVVSAGGDQKRATVFLPRAVHLYAGSDVVVLGVRVGEVTGVNPQGDRVRIELTYDADQPVPADAQAALVSPTLVADRYLQLTPVYSGGPMLPDGGTIPLARGQVPVELDQIVASLQDLAEQLGPNGANSTGALSDLIGVAADNLDGNGAEAGQTIEDVSKLTGTLADDKDVLFDSIRNLQQFVTELAQRDATVRSFSEDLAKVSGQLAQERAQLATALHQLALTLSKVTTFIRDNRSELAANVTNLAAIAEALDKEKESIAKVLAIAPTGISNFAHIYNPTSRALNGRINGNDKYESPAYLLCSMFSAVGLPAAQCTALLKPLADLNLVGLLGAGS